MKIGILTFHNANNYGAVLQAYALQQRLFQFGHDVEIINFYPNKSKKKDCTNKVTIIIEKIKRRAHLKALFVSRIRSKKFDAFRKDYLVISEYPIYGDDEIINQSMDYDVYITGSDQIWNASISNNSLAFYLDFVKNKGKKIAYSASIGKSYIGSEEYDNMNNYLTKFNSISVREDSLKAILDEKFGIVVDVTLDPVFLCSKHDWLKLLRPCKTPTKYIFAYLLEYNDSLIQHARFLSKKFNLPIIYVTGMRKKIPYETFNTIGPQEFLYIVSNATYVCTNSFHGVAFSIIFEKQFYVFKHSRLNDRIETLLSKLELLDCYWKDHSVDYCDIDYKKVNQLLKIHIDKSMKYLIDSLKVSQKNGL